MEIFQVSIIHEWEHLLIISRVLFMMSEALQSMLKIYFDIVKQVSRVLDFKESDITTQDLRILEFVKEEQECTMSQLSKSFPLPASTATRFVDRLINNKYLKRRHSTEDRRKILLSLSPTGERIVEKREGMRREYFYKMFRNLSAEDITTLEEIFKKMDIPKKEFL